MIKLLKYPFERQLSFLQVISVPIIFLVSLFFRIWKLWLSTPFWVDEFSTASQARLLLQYGLKVFNQPDQYFEYHNISTHLIVALVFKIFGESEFVARAPFAVFGACIPVVIFFLAKKIFKEDINLGVSAGWVGALFSATSYFLITWSRQSRGYSLQQLLGLLLFLTYFSLLDEKKSSRVLILRTIFGVLVVLGTLTHTLFLLCILAIGIHYCIYNAKSLRSPAGYSFVATLAIMILGLSLYSGLLSRISAQLQMLASGQIFNNFWFYHAFLWREYGLISFLAVVGICVGLLFYRKTVSLLAIFMLIHMIFIGVLFGPYVTRYLLPVFSLLFLFAGAAIAYFTQLVINGQKKSQFTEQLRVFIPVIIAACIVLNGYIFTVKPKQFYSVNHQSREIALIDYTQVYGLIKQKGKLEEGRTAVIDTWTDRWEWYLGENFEHAYTFRWMDAEGLMKSTPYRIDENGQKTLVDHGYSKFIGELADLQTVMKKYPRGFIWIDDTSLPADVLDFVQKNFHKELYLDHYSLDDNPYSIWPGTLYSWGLEPARTSEEITRLAK